MVDLCVSDLRCWVTSSVHLFVLTGLVYAVQIWIALSQNTSSIDSLASTTLKATTVAASSLSMVKTVAIDATLNATTNIAR